MTDKIRSLVDDTIRRCVGVPPEFAVRFRALMHGAAADAREETLREVERLLERERDREVNGEAWREVVSLQEIVTEARFYYRAIKGDIAP